MVEPIQGENLGMEDLNKGEDSALLQALKDLADNRNNEPSQTEAKKVLDETRKDITYKAVEGELLSKPQDNEEPQNYAEWIAQKDDAMSSIIAEFSPDEIKVIIEASKVEGQIVEMIAQGKAIRRMLAEIDPAWESKISGKVQKYLRSKVFSGKREEKISREFEEQMDLWLYALKDRDVLLTSKDYSDAQETYNTWLNNLKENPPRTTYQNKVNSRLLGDQNVQLAQGIVPFN